MLSGMFFFFFFIPCPPWSRLLFITRRRKEVRQTLSCEHREVCFSGSVILIKLQPTSRCRYFYSLGWYQQVRRREPKMTEEEEGREQMCRWAVEGRRGKELAGQRWAQSEKTSIIMSCFCCITRGWITSSSRLFLPWRRSGAAPCLLALTVSPARVMRGSSSVAGLLQMDVEPLWATGWLTRLPVDCTFTPFRDLILHERSERLSYLCLNH